MRSLFGVISLGLLLSACIPAYSQIEKPVVSLQLDGAPQAVQIPPQAMLYTPQCDSTGAVYVRYSVAGDETHPFELIRVNTDGKTQTIPPVAMTNSSADSHVFLFATGNDDSLHEILRVPDETDTERGATQVRYVTFDTDGSLSSQAVFADEFIPSALVPLPSGDFFASGVVLDNGGDGVYEGPVAGIFGSNAQLKRKLQNTGNGLVSVAAQEEDSSTGMTMEGAIIRLGGDGNLYVLIPGDRTRVDVVSQTGRVLRHMQLDQPFTNGVAEDMRPSGNRLLIVYEGECSEGPGATMYVVYDPQTGEVIRQYRPEFSGTLACFEDGQTISVLVKQPSSGNTAIGTAELQ
jgi:hypothetical protein